MATAQMMDVKGMKAVLLDLGLIKAIPAMQPRVEIDIKYCVNMTDAYKLGDDIPPPVHVFWDGKVYWLVDGFHRYKALKALEYMGNKYRQIRAYIHNGTRNEATVFASQANLGPRSKPMDDMDKKKAMWMLMRLPEWQEKSSTVLGNIFGFSNPTALKIWKEYFPTHGMEIPDHAEGSDGKIRKTTLGLRSNPKYPRTYNRSNGTTEVRVGNKTLGHFRDPQDAQIKLADATQLYEDNKLQYERSDRISRTLDSRKIQSKNAYEDHSKAIFKLHARSVNGIAITWESFREKSNAPAAFGRAMHAKAEIGATRTVVLCPVEDGPREVMDDYTKAYGVEWMTIEDFVESLKDDTGK